jgi:outer membrane biogenesis lipoprotein LolB
MLKQRKVPESMGGLMKKILIFAACCFLFACASSSKKPPQYSSNDLFLQVQQAQDSLNRIQNN